MEDDTTKYTQTLNPIEQDYMQHEMPISGDNPSLSPLIIKDCLIVIIGGNTPESCHIFRNVFSSSQECTEQAKEDWLAGRLAKIVDDEDEFIPLS